MKNTTIFTAGVLACALFLGLIQAKRNETTKEHIYLLNKNIEIKDSIIASQNRLIIKLQP